MQLFRLLFYSITILFIGSCVNSPKSKSIPFKNYYTQTQGTSIQLIYQDSLNRDFGSSIDSILKRIDGELSTYIETSIISQFNNNKVIQLSPSEAPLLVEMLSQSFKIQKETNGAFDPCLKNLMEYYSFDKTLYQPVNIDSSTVDSLNQIDRNFEVSYFDEYNLETKVMDVRTPFISSIRKSDKRNKLDLNAIAQGYSVDLVASFLDKKSIKNYLIELGGEIRVQGKNSKNELWTLGIDLPLDSLSSRELHSKIQIENMSLATSGNYRKFYVIDGIKYSHTIDPKTGYPAKNSILSATVIHESCAMADAYATVFMVMGLDKALGFLNKPKNRKLDVVFIYFQEGKLRTYVSSNLKDQLIMLNED